MKIKTLLVATFGLIVGVSIMDTPTITHQIVPDKNSVNSSSPSCMKVYEWIEHYADSFDIPKRYAYGIAWNETRYNGPFHFKYNPAQTSSANAVGPMQVKVGTARYINKDNVSIDRLRTDIRYNVMTSMKLLRRLKNKHGDWKLVFGAYNTGRPMINDYAMRVYNHKINWE